MPLLPGGYPLTTPPDGLNWSSQVPYFDKPLVHLPGGFPQTYAGGYVNGLAPTIGPGGRYPVDLSVDQYLTQIWLPVAVTGSVPSGVNMIVAVYHTGWDAFDTVHSSLGFTGNFGALTPDATASLPLTSLPLVDPIYNGVCNPPPVAKVRFTLNTPVVFSGLGPSETTQPGASVQGSWAPAMLVYLDNGFVNTSNIVFGTLSGSTYVSGSLVYPDVFPNQQWYDGPIFTFSATCIPADPVNGGQQCGWFPDVEIDPVNVVRARAWAQVIGD